MNEHPGEDLEYPRTPGVSVDGPDLVPMPTGGLIPGGVAAFPAARPPVDGPDDRVYDDGDAG